MRNLILSLVLCSIIAASAQTPDSARVRAWRIAAAGGATPGAWTPADLGDDLQLWLDAADASTLSLSGADVLTWTDKSGNNRTMYAGVSPTYASNAVSFNGSSQYIVHSNGFHFALGTNHTFVVATAPAGALGRYFVAEGSSSSTAPVYSLLSSGAETIGGAYRWNSLIRNDANSARLSATVLFSAETFSLSRRHYEAIDSTTNVTAILDYQTQETPTAYTRTGTTTVNRFAIGALVRNSVGSYFKADVNDVIITRSLSLSERQKVQGYLAHKWGLTANLPADHPYKSTAPTK
jgi:hypothetical protein